MLSSLESTDFIKNIRKKAKSIIKKDRMRYEKVYETTEEYCKDNKIILSDINVLMKSDDKSYSYELYCENAYKHAVHLANNIHNKVGQWVKLRTVVTHQEFIIEYDMRPIITIYGIETRRGIDTYNLLNPKKVGDLHYMPSSIELIEIYHKLYNPVHADDWEDLVEQEEVLFNDVIKKSGGGKERFDGRLLYDDIQRLKYLVLTEFCGKFVKNYVVIGHWGFDIFTANSEDKSIRGSPEKLQVITSMSIENSIEDITRFLSLYTNAKITHKKQDLHIPNDFRTMRYTVYLGVPGKDGKVTNRAFMDVFDCGTFELIPYVSLSVDTEKNEKFQAISKSKLTKSKFGRAEPTFKSGIYVRIGNPFVLLRFLFIDMWIIKIIHAMGFINDDQLEQKIRGIKTVAKKIRNSKLMEETFGLDHVGVHKDYNISKKQDNLKKKMHPPYYPEKNIIKENAYRII